MALWMVRAGRSGEREQYALDNKVAVIGWDELPDLSPLNDQDRMVQAYNAIYPGAKPMKAANAAGQVRAFAHRIQVGDLIILPLKSAAALAVGRVNGPYKFCPKGPEGAKHQRGVEWLVKDLARTAVDQDLLYSLGAALTVCQIQRHHAEDRFKALLAGRAWKAPVESSGSINETADVDSLDDGVMDLEQVAYDRMAARLQAKFCGHELARLIDGILKAEGFTTFRSPPGADGGVDILAGMGSLGFGSPRIAVQVKSGDTPADVGVLRGLQGSMQTFGGEQGLLVSWGGFKHTTLKEAATHHFRLRLWDSQEIITNLLRVYDRLDEDLKADLPLKRIWTLADEADG